jgi:threonine dehydratase
MIDRTAIERARPVVAEAAIRTPLLGPLAGGRIWIKPECLQPIGSFKIRGAWNAVRKLAPERLARGVWTAGAGNMAQGLAFAARRAGAAATIVVPEGAPAVKLRAIEALGARILTVPFDRWWSCFRDRAFPGLEEVAFVSPFDDDNVMAGNGTIGLEILEDLPDVESVLVPWGGGGLACGIAAALRGSGARVVAVEVETAAPLRASVDAGRTVEVPVTRSFVDGIGGPSCFPRMFELAREQGIAESIVVTLDEVRAAVRRLAVEARIVAEGAGAAALAAGARAPGRAVAVVSGGNIDPHVFAEILR